MLQLLLWLRDGPLVRIAVYPATREAVGVGMIGLSSKEIPGAIDVIAVSIFSTGRQPVYVDTLMFKAVARRRTRLWRLLSLQWLRTRLGVVRDGRQEEVHLIPLDGLYVSKARLGKIEPAERRDLVFHAHTLLELEAKARADGLSGAFRAQVTLGNGRTVVSAPYQMSRPPRSAFMDLEFAVAPAPAQSVGSAD